MDARDFMPDAAVIEGIRGNLASYEGRRGAAHGAVRWRVPVFLGLLIAATVLVAWGFNRFADPQEQWLSSPHMFLYVGAFFAAFFVYSLATKPATDLQQSLRDELLPIAFGFVKDMQYSRKTTPRSFASLPRQVVGTFNRQGFDDIISGTYEDFSFELYEASLSHKVGKSDTKVFKGVIVAFRTVQTFTGLLVATRKTGKVTKFFAGLFGGGKLAQIESGVPALDAAYDFRTDNEPAARPLVGGRLAQALIWLRDAWPEAPGLVALHGNDGFLLLPQNKNFFELPPISVPLDYKAHVEPIIADMAAMLATAALVRKACAAEAEPQP